MFTNSWFTSLVKSNARRSRKFDRNRRRTNFFRPLATEQLEDRRLLAVNVVTDLPDYAPGETANFSGSGFGVGATINLQVVRTDGIANISPANDPFSVVDGGAGDLVGQRTLATWRWFTTR